MHIEPRIPKASADNSRGNTSMRRFLVNTGLVFAFFISAYFALGGLSLAIVHLMPVSWEQHFAFAVPDSWSDDVPPHVQTLFDELVASDESGRSYRLKIIDDETPNAFAMPDGTIALTRGLLAQSESEQELAFVIGHEIGHVQARHSLKRMSRSVVYGLARTLLLGENEALAPFLHAEGLAHLHFSRDQESQADFHGLDMVQQRYGHVGGADHFLVKAAEQAGMYPEWVATHPHPEERTEALRAHAAQQGWPQRGTTPLPEKASQTLDLPPEALSFEPEPKPAAH